MKQHFTSHQSLLRRDDSLGAAGGWSFHVVDGKTFLAIAPDCVVETLQVGRVLFGVEELTHQTQLPHLGSHLTQAKATTATYIFTRMYIIGMGQLTKLDIIHTTCKALKPQTDTY